jgi:hypothetical protein
MIVYTEIPLFPSCVRNNVTIREINPVLKEEFVLRAMSSYRKLFALEFGSTDQSQRYKEVACRPSITP